MIMSAETWVHHPQKRGFSTLNVPFRTDRGQENASFVYSLTMTIEFVSEAHPAEWVRENMSTLSTSTIRENLTIDEAGWKAKNSEEDFEAISEEAGPINFDHKLRDRPPAEETMAGSIKDHLSRNVPLIPFINSRILRQNKCGGVNPVVVTGMNEDSVAFHDPLGHPKDIVDREVFLQAWDDVLNQVVTVSLGGQQTLGSQRLSRGESE